MWSERIDQLKRLRQGRQLQPYEWVEASSLVVDDRLYFAGKWMAVDKILRNGDGFDVVVATGTDQFTIEFLPFEAVRVRLPRPEAVWTTDPAA